MHTKDFSLLAEAQEVWFRVRTHSNVARHINSNVYVQSATGLGQYVNWTELPNYWVRSGIVNKIGRKYISVKHGNQILKFDKNTGVQYEENGYSPDYELFPSREEAHDDILAELLCVAIKQRVSRVCTHGHDEELSLDNLKTVASLVGIQFDAQPDKKEGCEFR